MPRRDVSVKTERNPQNRNAESRSRPFASVLLVAWLAIPALILALRVLVGVGGDNIKWLIVWLDLLLLGTALPGAAVAYGYKVVKRAPFVIWHVAVTLHLFAVAVSLGMLPGWGREPAGNRWWDAAIAWLANVFVIPLWLVIVYFLASLCLALSWLIYRIDSFRSSTSETASTDAGGPLGALLKRLEGVKVHTNAVVIDEVAAEIPIDHEGVPLSQVRGLIPAIEEHPAVVRGRSSVIENSGGHSTLRIVHADPHDESRWRVWPGLSAPGGSFTEPIRTSYYSTGETQWYSFVATPQGMTFAPGPGEDKSTKLGRAQFRSPNGAFKGAQGMTSAGKSGDAAIEVAEVLSRRNVQVIYVDPAKLIQNAGWCLDFVSLAAGSPASSGALFAGLRRLFEYRASMLGEARNFTDEVAERTGLSWVYVFADEFDIAKQGANMDWLATKGRSLGLRLSFTLPRAVGDKMSTDVRAAVGMWAQFGITQDYDKGFVLSDETIAAGANPEAFGASLPGVHYLDRAPGIPAKMWPIDCRSYRTREDFGDLRRAVEAARATFTPPTWTDGEREALGEVVRYCTPSLIRSKGVNEAIPPKQQHAVPAANPQAVAAIHEAGRLLDRATANERGDMQATQELPAEEPDVSDMPYDQQLASLLEDDADVLDTSDEEREFGPVDPRNPRDVLDSGDGIQLQSSKPRPRDREHAVKEFDEALVRMADRGVREFSNADVLNEMTVVMSAGWVSKRFSGLCSGDIVQPPGLTIERIEGGRGQFMLIRLDA